MYWLYLAGWIWVLGTLLAFAILWLGFESLWTDADPGEERPQILSAALFFFGIAASWPYFVVYGLVRGRPPRCRR